MLIKSTENKLIFRSSHKTAKEALEYCAEKRVPLAAADLRRTKLSRGSFDNLLAPSASLWGVDLSNSDLAGANLNGADMRGANLKGTCLAFADLTGADLRGAYFESTILEGAIMESVSVSCPSLWRCDLRSCRSIKGLIYWHRGELRFGCVMLHS